MAEPGPVEGPVDDPVEDPVEERDVDTSQGPARVHLRVAAQPRLAVLLQHGANGSVTAQDLVALATSLPAYGVSTALLQQPFAVAGKKVAPRPVRLDESLAEVVPAVAEWVGAPLVLGGRSSGARCSTRQAQPLGAVAALALAFPLHPPGRPEKSRADELLGCALPTLVVQGTRDAFGGPDEFPELLTHQRLHVVPGADHGFRVPRSAVPGQQDTLRDVVAVVLSWLDEVAAGGG